MLRRLWRLLRPSLEVAWITPELALGPRFEKRQVGALARAGIGSVIDVRSEASDDEEALAKHDIRLCHLPVDDRRAPTQAQLEEATQWALKEIAAGRRIYVHCRSGIGRSPSLAIAILMAMGYPLPDAYDAVRRRRAWATLSAGQWEALEQFERSLQARRSAGAEERPG
jgi:protein-tyrosine phosphatase